MFTRAFAHSCRVCIGSAHGSSLQKENDRGVHAAGLGGPIRVSDPRGAREGAFEGLDGTGRLLLRTAQGVETIEAADLYLAPPLENKESAGP